MNMTQARISVLLILVVFSSICQQAPAISTRPYELGTTYKYQYSTAVLLNEPPPLASQNSTKPKGTDVGYQVAATVELTAIWQDPSNSAHVLLELLMSNPKLSIRSRKAQQPDGFADHSSPLDDLQNSGAVYLDWSDGRISQIYSFDSESPSLLNFKKGIASLFQLQSSDAEVTELDASGSCTATYKNLGERTLLKNKKNCQFERPNSSFARPQKILGVSAVSSHQNKYNLKSDSNVVETLTSTEVHSLRVSLRTQAGASVISRQYLRLDSESQSGKKLSASSLAKAIESVAMENNIKLVEDNLQIVEEAAIDDARFKSLKETVNELRKGLQTTNVATTLGASAFVRLLPVVRRSSKADILAQLKDSKNQEIVPQFLDVVAAAQTADSYDAAVEFINFQAQDITLAERFLQVVSLSTRPTEHLLDGLLKLSKKIASRSLSETTLLSLATVTKTFAANPDKANAPLVADIKKYFMEKLKACTNEDCTQLYMRVLKNLASPDMLPVILTYIDSKDKKTSVGATKALKALPASVFDDRVKEKLQRVYFQIGRRYDSSARTLALDTLLEHQPDSSFLLDVLTAVSLGGKADSEINTYTLQRLHEFAGNDLMIRSILKQILSTRPSLNSYQVFAQNGLSTAFTRDLYRSANGNGTFSSATEAMSGMMKRSAFEIFMQNSDESYQLLSFGLFAGGLGGMMGSSGDESEDEEPTAGMEITLAGSQLRPVVFFTGQGELMGHIWSGTASERTSALQATVLLQDHRQVVPLQSGFVAVLDVHGSVSFDFGGEIQISIWNRNSHSVVENIAAWELDGSLNLLTPFVKSSVDFTVGAQAKIDFVTDVNFGDGLLMCLRMGQDKFPIDYTVQKRESIPGTKHWIHKRKKRQDVIPGRTYALNDKNSAFCNEMFATPF